MTVEASGQPEAVDFPTRVDAWVVLVLFGSAVVSVGAVAAGVRAEPRESLIAGAVVAASFGLVAALSLPTRYTVESHALVIRSGFMRDRIPLEAIERVRPTRNPLAAPAWSLHRLEITYRRARGPSMALVSPSRREEFLTILAERAGLEREGETLRRSA